MANIRLSKKYTPKNRGLPDAPLVDLIVTNRASPNYQTKATFLIDSGADFTVVGYNLIETLHLEGKGGVPVAGVGTGPKSRKLTKVYLEIPERQLKKSVNAIMIEPENKEQANDKKTMELLSNNYLGRDFLNDFCIVLNGLKLEYTIYA